MSRCVFCNSDGGEVIWRSELCRVVFADEPDYPGFMRVVLNAHVKEMTDLAASDRAEVMRVVFAVEAAIRQVMRPDKINMANLGNKVPHVHWHVVPRYVDDPHFPNPVWSLKRRELSRPAHSNLNAQLVQALNKQLGTP
jgi:diadenosine tetraphosphate (Ap4A) HIT family hydrolase